MGDLRIIEGIDGSGKTSIQEYLVRTLNARTPVFPLDFWKLTDDNPTPELYYEKFLQIEDQIITDLQYTDVFITRSVITVPAMFYAYGKQRIEMPDFTIQPKNIIHVTASDDVIKGRLEERVQNGEDLAPHEKYPRMFARLRTRYGELLDHRDDVLKVDTTHYSAEQAGDFIINTLGLKYNNS